MTNDITDILDGSRTNWGRWGDEDEIGSLNYLTPQQVLRGVAAVETGETFALGIPLGSDDGDPKIPSRAGVQHYMTRDKSHYDADKVEDAYLDPFAGVQIADDVLFTPVQGTTHFDALGHVWYDDHLYNGFPAETTTGGLERCSIAPIANHGVVGRAVLLDVARYRGVDHLDPGERVTLDTLESCAETQGIEIEPRDILLVRTGWLEVFYEEGPEAFYGDGLDEPGLTYSPDLVDWFHRMEIPVLATDTLANEQTISDETGTRNPLHAALLRDLGVLFCELNWFAELADACADDEAYDMLYVGAPLEMVGATGSPVNPVVVR
ncbi:MAG: cyclase family protein [Halobacteriota archaeon]